MAIQRLLSSIPKVLGRALNTHYEKIKQNFLQGKYEPSELNGAKFSEVVVRILQWYVSPDHSYTSIGTKIANFDQATRQFENKSNCPDSIRFHIPRILNVLYGIRNKRGVGHVGGDINPNHMDAVFVVSASDWVLAELVRIFHDISHSEAEEIVESIISRRLPVVWDVAGRKRVLDQNMPYKDKVLVMLHSAYPHPISGNKLFDWTEHSNISSFRRRVLTTLHQEKLIEWAQASNEVYLSPKGLKEVEERIL